MSRLLLGAFMQPSLLNSSDTQISGHTPAHLYMTTYTRSRERSSIFAGGEIIVLFESLTKFMVLSNIIKSVLCFFYYFAV